MLTFKELLETYYVFRHERTVQTTDQLNRLRQQVESQLLTIREREFEFVTAQQNILDQLRPQLATDARVLFSTPEFQTFVESLLRRFETNVITNSYSQQIAPTPDAWLLSSLPFALQLHDIEMIHPDNSDVPNLLDTGIKLRIELADWQHRVFVLIYSTRLWFETIPQVEQSILQQPFSGTVSQSIATQLQPILAQELTCLLVYIETLFHINIQAEQFECFTFIERVKS
jgi:hypothetical protein